ncbi:hypothetical protein MMC22_002824 [Lobaria immixta]|nr:hypothetical protein [Lobaria immixta]
MNATKNSQENTSEISSRRGKRKAKQAAKKNGNANKNTNASLSAQQLTINIEVSSDGKTRIVSGGMEYKIGNGWISAIDDENSTENFRDLTDIGADEARRPNRGKFLNRARKHALDEFTRQKRNEIEEQRSEKLEARHNEIMGAAPLLALAIPLPQGQSRKRKREPSSLDPESEEENTRSAKRQEWAFNIDPALLHVEGSVEASNAFVGSAPDFGLFDPFFKQSKPAKRDPGTPRTNPQLRRPGIWIWPGFRRLDNYQCG